MANKEEKKEKGDRDRAQGQREGQGGKREYEEEVDGGQRKKSRIGEVATVATSSSPLSASANSLPVDRSSPNGDDDDYELCDDGVRKYITNAGGRVKIADLKEVFKLLILRFPHLQRQIIIIKYFVLVFIIVSEIALPCNSLLFSALF